MTIPPSDHDIAFDMEKASYDNYDTYEILRTIRPDGPNTVGIAQTRCDDCGYPLIVSEYGTWYGSGAVSRFTPMTIYYTCECKAGI